VVNEQVFQFDWDEAKADTNMRKHRVTFEMAATVFLDPHLVTLADIVHSHTEDRWFSLGMARSGALLAVVYLWSYADPATIKVRLISARRESPAERDRYREGL
jgi:uncharacterized DUF497 family protein